MDIKINIEDFSTTHLAIEDARREISTLAFSPDQGISRSQAMTAFRKNVRAYIKLLESYSALLDNDCQKLLDTVRGIVEADAGEAKTYLSGIPNIVDGKSKSNSKMKSTGPMY